MALSKSGYIKAVAVHMKTSLGRPMENAEEIVRQVKQYEAKNPDLIVFGELSISGYSCGDLFLQSFMEEQCRMAITYLCDNLPQSDTLIAVGAPLRKDGMLFNTALIFKGNEPVNKIFDILAVILAKIFSKSPESYKYLILSKNSFLSPEKLACAIETQGLKCCKIRKWAFGMVSVQLFIKDCSQQG